MPDSRAQAPAAHDVFVNEEAVATWLRAGRRERDREPIPRIPQPDIAINIQQRRATYYQPQPTAPSQHPQVSPLRLCKHCGREPVSQVQVRPWHPHMALMCGQCRDQIIDVATRIAWRHPDRPLESIIVDLMSIYRLAGFN